MKKICSLVKATMTSDMSLFKINRKSYSKRKNTLLYYVIKVTLFIMNVSMFTKLLLHYTIQTQYFTKHTFIFMF